MFYVYVIRDPRPGKNCAPIYVGKGKGKRSQVHLKRSSNPMLARAILRCRALGLDMNIEKVRYFEVEADAFAYEMELIALYGRRNLGTGTLYNLTDGGEGASGAIILDRKLSAATRAKIGAAHRGRIFSPETRAKLSAAQLGKKQSPETLATLSAIRRGKKPSPETRAKMRAAHAGRKHTREARARIGLASRSRKHSTETRARLSAAQRGKVASPITRAKMSATHRARRMAEKARQYTDPRQGILF